MVTNNACFNYKCTEKSVINWHWFNVDPFVATVNICRVNSNLFNPN